MTSTKPKLTELKLPIAPDDERVSLDKTYLVKYAGRWAVGSFSRQWYGLNFQGIYDAGVQVDYDGWEAIYEFVDPTKRKKAHK